MAAAGAVDGVSVAIDGVVSPSNALIVIGSPPGLVLFNGALAGGGIGGLGTASVPGLTGSRTLDAILTSNAGIVQEPFGFELEGLFDVIRDFELDALEDELLDDSAVASDPKKKARKRPARTLTVHRRTTRPAVF